MKKIPIAFAILLPITLVLFASILPEPKLGGPGNTYLNLLFVLNFTTLLIPAMLATTIESLTNVDLTENLILIFGMVEMVGLGYLLGLFIQELFFKKS